MSASATRTPVPFSGVQPIRLLVEPGVGELAAGPTIFRSVVADSEAPLVRLYRPEPIVAFGGRDRRHPGFDAAVEAARFHGFGAAVRAPGGHAVAYHENSVCVEVFACDADPHGGTVARFEAMAALFREALAMLGIDAAMGAVPDEYCPGDHSVNLGGRRKLVGTAQRIAKGGWFFGAGVVCERPEPIRAVLADVYAALAMPFAPMSVCATNELDPRADADAFTNAFIRVLDQHAEIRPVAVEDLGPTIIGSARV